MRYAAFLNLQNSWCVPVEDGVFPPAVHLVEDDFDDALQDDEAASVVIKGSEDDSLDGSIWESIETGKPPEWMVMKEVSCNAFCFSYNSKPYQGV